MSKNYRQRVLNRYRQVNSETSRQSYYHFLKSYDISLTSFPELKEPLIELIKTFIQSKDERIKEFFITEIIDYTYDMLAYRRKLKEESDIFAKLKSLRESQASVKIELFEKFETFHESWIEFITTICMSPYIDTNDLRESHQLIHAPLFRLASLTLINDLLSYLLINSKNTEEKSLIHLPYQKAREKHLRIYQAYLGELLETPLDNFNRKELHQYFLDRHKNFSLIFDIQDKDLHYDKDDLATKDNNSLDEKDV